jgi:hypothetical protein
MGVPSKLGVARRSRIAWLKVFSCFAVFAVIAFLVATASSIQPWPSAQTQQQTTSKIALQPLSPHKERDWLGGRTRASLGALALERVEESTMNSPKL